MTALPFTPRRRGTALLTVLLGLAQAASVRTRGSGKVDGASGPEAEGAGGSSRAPVIG